MQRGIILAAFGFFGLGMLEPTPELRALLIFLALPPVPMLILIIAGTLLLRRKPRWSRALLGLGVLSLWLSCSEAGAQWLSRHLVHVPLPLTEAQLKDLHTQQAASHDMAVLVLGGGATEWVPEYGRAELKPLSVERLRYGIWLSRQIGAPLGFTGGPGWNRDVPDMSEAELAQRTALEYGVNLRWAENQARDTRANAAYSVPLLIDARIHTVVLVTHGLHMPRTLRNFQQVANGKLQFVTAPMGLHSAFTPEFQDWLPNAKGLERVRYAVYEWLALRVDH